MKLKSNGQRHFYSYYVNNAIAFPLKLCTGSSVAMPHSVEKELCEWFASLSIFETNFRQLEVSLMISVSSFFSTVPKVTNLNTMEHTDATGLSLKPTLTTW
jgi:hypothetical protein